ncbi:hypothetical protein IV102_17365 [bacterium]|nr:hypothetical protein [bacterium]
MKRLNTLLSGLCLLSAPALAEPPGLQFEQATSASSVRPVANPSARTVPLSLTDLKQLLSRLTPLKAQPEDRVDFALREGSLPAPKTGKRIPQAFPPAQNLNPPAIDKKPVEVLRYAPEGEVELAPQLSVTFNQPMVDLSSTAVPKSVPVRLSPEVPGEWRWVGTQTLVFKPKTRLPMATEFKAEVEAAKPVSWTFGTPAPRLKQSYPTGNGIALRPVLFVAFDQRIDVDKVASLLELSGGNQRIPLRRANAEEIVRDERVRALSKAAEPERWVAVVADQPLPAGTHFSLKIPAGTPSLEGPRTTTAVQSFNFSTYFPLAIDGQSSQNQAPGSPLWVSFNNPLAPGQPLLVSVTPELPGMRAVVRGDNLWIHGRTKGHTKYTVTVPASLRDTFDQKLGPTPPLEFQMGGAPAMFVPPRKRFVLLDPAGSPQLNFTVVNHKKLSVTVRAVKPEDWKAYHEALNHRYDQDKFQLPGEVIMEQEIDAAKVEDEIEQVTLDLSKAFGESSQLLVQVVPPELEEGQKRYRTYYGWVQRSKLGANLAADGDKLLVWVNQLADGKPVAGARVRFVGGPAQGETGSDGLATLKWGNDEGGLLISHQNDSLFVPRHSDYSASSFNPGRSSDQTLWYVTDDRKLYKPGETVSVKGWLRRQIHQPKGDLQASSDRTVNYVLYDSRNNEISKGKASVGQLGGFDFTVALPKNFNLGSARIQLTSDSSSHQHRFEVQEFRRPEFEVSAQASSGSVLVGGQGSLAVEAKYYAGGGLKDAPVQWTVTGTPTNYSPPHWPGFSFGSWTPWFNCFCWWDRGAPAARASTKTFSGRTDSRGKDSLDLNFLSVSPPRPHSVSATATVADVNRQAWSSTATMLVHPASHYVGIKAKRTFVDAGKPLDYELIVTNLDGKAVAGREIDFKVYRYSWEYSDSDYRTSKKEVYSQRLTSAATPIHVSVPTSEGGTYQVEATVSDDSNRSNQSQMTSWVAGGKQPPKRDVEMQQLTLIPNKPAYEPDEVAEILVQSPFTEAQGLVTLERHGIVSHQFLDLSSGSATLKVPLEEAFLPNLHLTVDVVGKEPRADGDGNPVAGAPPRPAQAQGGLNLAISAKSRELNVEVRPHSPKAAPGSQNQLEVVLKDASGKAVADGEVALLVVDESVLALIGGDYANPWDLFYSQRAAEVAHYGVRSWIELAMPGELPAPPPPPMQAAKPAAMAVPSEADDGVGNLAAGLDVSTRERSAGKMDGRFKDEEKKGKVRRETPIRMRKDFSALAYYVPAAKTDREGRIKLPFKLPDNLTRYRVVALAVSSDKQFGKGQSSLVAQQPLMVRPSPPRFLNFGDRCELPVVIQNQTDKPLPVELACRTSNLKLDPSKAGVSLSVPANDRVEVRFPVTAESAGTARFQVAVSSGDFSDAAQLDFPVWTPATTEAFATYGVIDQGAIAQPVSPPPDVFRQFGGLEVSTSSTALAELTDAFLYLRSYPYECAEQVSSRVLSTVALAPVLRAFEAPGMPGEAALKASLAADIKKLEGMQNYDGGWDYWKRDKPSVPYVSLHVSHALVRLRKAGHSVADSSYDRALQFTSNIESHIPGEYSEWTKRHLRAYALYVLHKAGKADLAKARKLIQDFGGVEKTPFECLGWLLPTLSKDDLAVAIRRHLNNRVSESASTAQFTSNYEDGSYLILASDHRDDAILLEALIEDSPTSDLLPKLVRGLLDHRVAGRWANTQENCFVLLALQEYFEKFEKVTPDFVARVWLGDRFAGQQTFKGRSADSKELRVPMDQLQGRQDLLVTKEGAGRLYYRLGMKYAPTHLQLPPLERGFSVERRYEAVDDNRDVSHKEDGSWRIKSGSKVKVTVTMVCPTMRYHVALVDPLPAGLEALNPALRGTEPVRPMPTARGGRTRWWWNPWWYEHENLRDERVEAFSQWVYYGVHEYTYFARATTPGNFVVPPAKAEEMYHPETFGRSASDRVIVE